MRNLVQPLPSMHCARCGGELLFKRIDPVDPAFDIEVQIFVCAKCGNKHSRKLMHDPYAPHTARMPSGRVALPKGPG
jgi:DNA-directed RNA polymerase subunit RPC12/RpoP